MSSCIMSPEAITALFAAHTEKLRELFPSQQPLPPGLVFWSELQDPKNFNPPAPDINHAPKMSNRKLRHELDELKKEVAKLREELAARPTVIVREVLAPQPVAVPSSWPHPYQLPGSTCHISGVMVSHSGRIVG